MVSHQQLAKSIVVQNNLNTPLEIIWYRPNLATPRTPTNISHHQPLTPPHPTPFYSNIYISVCSPINRPVYHIISITMTIGRRLLDTTLDSARESYHILKTRECENPGLSRQGLLALDYFFLDYRIRTKVKLNMSFYDAITNKVADAHLEELIRRWKKRDISTFSSETELLKAKFQVFQLYYGTVNQFRPTFAKWIYCTLKPTVGILDFSAGWGGRCMAAMALGIPYIGIDANTSLRLPYERMIKAYEPTADVTMIFKPSETVDFSKFKYDLVFTSPPYFMLERYANMPAYSGNAGFIEEFFRPVISKVWKHLMPGGKMALNMPHEMYMSVRDLLPKVSRRIQMPIHHRQLTKDSTKGVAHELVYVWHKS